jgi:ATP-dependent RNA helicase DHX40
LQEEIEKACDLLFKKSEKLSYRHDVHDAAVTGMWILPLYGSMSTDLQQRVFDPV